MADARAAGPPIPGVVIVWSGDGPMLQPLRLPSLGLILGRELLGPKASDDRISRQHARVRWNGTSFAITDLGSRNGTYVGGTLVSENEVTVTAPCVLRTGRTVSVLLGDVRPYEHGEVKVSPTAGAGVVGPRRAVTHEQLRKAAEAKQSALMLVGEPGAGDDAAVAVFHEAAGGGPLVDVDAPHLDAAASARWWTGAKDSDEAPLAAAAHGGTLVIHDVAGLDATGQQAVAQILATGELGRWPVDARVVVTCDPDDVDAMRAAVTSGGFRDDLWRRIQHRIDLPPLRACCEEIPHWVLTRVRDVAPDLAVHSTLIEACLLRPWPGNVDELRHDIGAAATAARDAGKRTVRGEHLDLEAGMLIALSMGHQTSPNINANLIETAKLKRSRAKNPLEEPAVRTALAEAHGDLGRAAIALGVHQNRLRRFIAEHDELGVLVAGTDLYRTGVVSEDD